MPLTRPRSHGPLEVKPGDEFLAAAVMREPQWSFIPRESMPAPANP